VGIPLSVGQRKVSIGVTEQALSAYIVLICLKMVDPRLEELGKK